MNGLNTADLDSFKSPSLRKVRSRFDFQLISYSQLGRLLKDFVEWKWNG